MVFDVAIDGLVIADSQRLGRGINGDPTTPSKSWISAFRLPKMVVMEWCDFSVFGFIHDFMFCHDLLVLLLENISSGIGTSRTVSNPSSRS
jgi:hypothetical protein